MKKPPVDLQSIIDAQDNPFVLIDENYSIVSANKAYCETYGITEDEIVGCKCHQVSHHSEVPCHQNGEDCPHKQVFDTGMPHQVLHIHYDKHNTPDRVRIKGNPVRGSDGKLYLGESVFRLAPNDNLDCSEQAVLGKSPAFLAFLEQLERAAETNASVLLVGESGVGKDLAAQYVHKSSSRRGYSYIPLHCSTISESVFDCELFGHEPGAFNGCVGRRSGLFETADGGTLFIDEVSEIPLEFQGRLLSALESGAFRRVGGRETLEADVRVVSCTNRNLAKLVEEGAFRADLYYRLAGIKINIPPLRERAQDIPTLAEALLTRVDSKHRHVYTITDAAMEKLVNHSYPGNIRELKNILQQAALLSTNGIISPDLIKLDMTLRPGDPGLQPHPDSQKKSIKDLEQNRIAELLNKHDGHRRKVADELGISERTLYRKLDRYGLNETGKPT
jgi:transcriptional regulator with PAS, ATPase and Fis domain